MLRAFICWLRGHDWPPLTGTPGKMHYFRCRRCGEPNAEMVPYSHE